MTNKRVGLFGILAMAGAAFTALPAAAATHFSVGIGVQSPYGYNAPRPPYPGAGYYWTDGYYDPYGSWLAGYWAAPRYVAPRAYVAPRFNENLRFGGDLHRDFGRENNFNSGGRNFQSDNRRSDHERGNAHGARH